MKFFTLEEGKDTRLDHVIMKVCKKAIETYDCDAEPKDEFGNDDGRIMSCLVKHKSDQVIQKNEKCLCGIEHFQIVSLKNNITFSPVFKESCLEDVKKFCLHSNQNKSSLVTCLSERVRNATLLGFPQEISEKCRSELKAELLQRSENIELDPELYAACKRDIKKHCSNLTPGQAVVFRCLKTHKSDLDISCHKKLFDREQIQAVEQTSDFVLVKNCKSAIKKFCSSELSENLFSCLKHYKFDAEMDVQCRNIINKRQIERAKDFRLNPKLARSCKLDIPKFCHGLYDEIKDENKDFLPNLEGKMIACLKKNFIANKLSSDCRMRVETFVKEAHQTYELNPQLVKFCESDVKTFCNREKQTAYDDRNSIQECLIRNIEKLQQKECKVEVARYLQEEKTDVHVDAHLFETCSLDLKLSCNDVAAGEGRLMSCLLTLLEQGKLQKKCKTLLSSRKKLWELGGKIAPPETLRDIYYEVTLSASRNYFLVVFLVVIGVIFLGGLFCGRVTKRIRAELKNR